MGNKPVKYMMLVYQGGLANVFAVKCLNLSPYGREAKLIYQGAFRGAEIFCHGAGAAGVVIRTAACNMAGEIVDQQWSEDLEDMPFHSEFRPVKLN